MQLPERDATEPPVVATNAWCDARACDRTVADGTRAFGNAQSRRCSVFPLPSDCLHGDALLEGERRTGVGDRRSSVLDRKDDVRITGFIMQTR